VPKSPLMKRTSGVKNIFWVEAIGGEALWSLKMHLTRTVIFTTDVGKREIRKGERARDYISALHGYLYLNILE